MRRALLLSLVLGGGGAFWAVASREQPVPLLDLVHFRVSPDAFEDGIVGDAYAADIPVEPLEPLAIHGREIFRINCVLCHDEQGTGRGPMTVSNPDISPPSLLGLRVRHLTTGEMFDTIGKGRGSMPGFGAILTPLEKWALIAHIRKIQALKPAIVERDP